MAQATARFGETFGIGSLAPGRAAGAVPRLVCRPAPVRYPVEAFFISTCVVALAEIGDKTQILALMLAGRFRKPLPIICGILLATLANHAAAAFAGTLLGSVLAGRWMQWLLGLSFLAVAVWALFPDECAAGDRRLGRAGPFLTTLVVFFLAEIGDKTQIATVGLAARFELLFAVVVGTTLGMMLANVPAVILGDRLAARLPVSAIRYTAALVFAALGIATIIAA